MNILSIKKENTSLELSYDELYTILQCIAEIRDYRSEGDIEAIIGLTKRELAGFGEKINSIKKQMESAP